MTEQKPVGVVIVDDQDLIRTGFAMILASDPDMEVLADAADGAAGVAAVRDLVNRGSVPQVVLMDVRMPGMDGIEATRRIVEESPETRVLVLTTFDLDDYAIEAIDAGASGFLLKDARADELLRAVQAVAAGDSVMAPSVTMRLMERIRGGESRGEGASEADPESILVLTEREREVFHAIAEGLSNAEIGERLFLSESTVKTHVGRVLAKLGLRDRVHVVILAYENGLR